MKKIINTFPSLLQPFIETIFLDRQNLYKKILNFTINRIEQRFGTSRLLSYPYQAVIDPTNICNLNCPLCPTWQNIDARPKGMMNFSLFKKIIDEIGPYLFTLNLCNWGEPFLNQELTSMVEYAKRFNIVVGLSTNLNYLTDNVAEKTIKAGIDIIVVSLDGLTQESYSKYRQKGDINKVFENIKKLNYYKKNNIKILIIWQFLVNKYNEKELDEAKSTADRLGLVFYPASMRSAMGKELVLPLYDRVKEMENWYPNNPKFRKYHDNITPTSKTNQRSCKWLWNSIVINWDGSISPCCGVFDKKYDFGEFLVDNNIKIHNLWNSPKYVLARKLVSAYLKRSKELGNLIKQGDSENLICVNCIRYGFLED